MDHHRTNPTGWWSAFALVLALGSPALDADAQDSSGAAAGPAKGATPEPTSDYGGACARGNAKYALRDFPAAVVDYHSAIEIDPKNPLAHYLLGEAQLAAGNITDADASWKRAAAYSGERDPALRARILFVIADLKERQWRWDGAKAAWQTYQNWTSRFPNTAAYPASARSRQLAIDAMLRQENAYEVVRRRIEETKDGGVFTDLSKSPEGGAN